MADSFYMVLPSNASLQAFPDNRPGRYRIRLPEMMHLPAHWKVGLMNLIFPSTFAPRTLTLWPSWFPWETLNIGKHWTSTSRWRTSRLGDLSFATRLTLEKNAAEHGLNLSDHITIRFFPRGTLSKIEIRTFLGSTLGFNAYLAQKLGLLTGNSSVPVDYYDSVIYRDNFVFILQESVVRLNVGREDTLSVVPSLKEQFLNLYVYADIVEPHSVGDTQANLLRIVPVKDKEVRIVSEEFAIPLYFILSRSNFNTVSILITDDNRNEVPFEDATVQVTLHFDRTLSHWCQWWSQDHPTPSRLFFPLPPISMEVGYYRFPWIPYPTRSIWARAWFLI